MPNPTVPAAATGLPVARPSVPASLLAATDSVGLLVMFQACQDARRALIAVCNQPRATGEAAGWIEDEANRLSWLTTSIVDEAAARDVEGVELEAKAEIMAAWAFACGAFRTNDPRLHIIAACAQHLPSAHRHG